VGKNTVTYRNIFGTVMVIVMSDQNQRRNDYGKFIPSLPAPPETIVQDAECDALGSTEERHLKDDIKLWPFQASELKALVDRAKSDDGFVMLGVVEAAKDNGAKTGWAIAADEDEYYSPKSVTHGRNSKTVHICSGVIYTYSGDSDE